MKILIGLGNPGKRYIHTRHNAGFLFLDFLQKLWQNENWKDSQFSTFISEGRISNKKILLCKPTTFMNLSGEAVRKILHFYKLLPQDILVISDDIDMEFGKVRIRHAGGHGGQNGLRDIITKIGTDNFSRIKIGIGRHEQIPVSDWVLSPFSGEELHFLETQSFPEAEKIVEKFIIS